MTRWIAASLAGIILIAGWFLRARNLDQFKLTDETKWAFRSANFSLALYREEYAETFQRSHPGVSTMWAGWFGMRIAMPDYDQNATRYVENTSYKQDLRQNGAEVMQILVPARQVVIAISMLVLAICYFYLETLFGFIPALLGTLLLTFEPFFVGHTRILHVDGFLSVFMYLSIIAYLAFLRSKRGINLVVSGVAAGLTWLTKTPGFYLAAGVALIAAIFMIHEITAKRDGGTLKLLFKTAWPLTVWAVVGIGTFFILWPAMWVEPVAIIKSLVFESIDYAVGGHTSPVVFNGVIYRDGVVPRSIWQYYPLCYLWRASPVVVVGLALALLGFLRHKPPFRSGFHRRAILGLFLFSIGFIVFMSVGSKRSDRYVLPAFPALSVAAGMGWAALGQWLWEISRSRWSRFLSPLIVAAAMVAHILLPIQHLPYFLSYFNPLMGGAKKAPEVLQIGWGEGLDEAARYLNALPGAEDMVVASWYERVFSEFFLGETYNIEDKIRISDGEIEDILGADYIVIYYHQFQRDMPENLLDLLENQEPIHTLWFNGLEYVLIYDPDTFTS